MTVKIKLTQEQADFIEKGLDSGLDKEEMLNKFANTKVLRGSTRHSLHGLCVMDLARALLIGYEVEPEPLKVGDWVVVTGGKNRNMIGMLLKITEIERRGPETRITFKNGDKSIWSYLRNTELRHATPEEIKAEKERRKWAGIHRKVGEFWDGDIALDRFGGVVHASEEMEAAYQMGDLIGFYPTNSFIRIKAGELND